MHSGWVSADIGTVTYECSKSLHKWKWTVIAEWILLCNMQYPYQIFIHSIFVQVLIIRRFQCHLMAIVRWKFHWILPLHQVALTTVPSLHILDAVIQIIPANASPSDTICCLVHHHNIVILSCRLFCKLTHPSLSLHHRHLHKAFMRCLSWSSK